MKLLSDADMAEIIYEAVQDEGAIVCEDAYQYFLEDLGRLIAKHFGGDFREMIPPDGCAGWQASFAINEFVPEDGGVYRRSDTDVTWRGGKEL